MKPIQLLTAVPLMFAIVACSEPTKTDEKSEQQTASIASLKTLVSPCEIVSEKDIRTIFALDNNVEIDDNDREVTHKTCSFEWKTGKLKRSQTIGKQVVEYEVPEKVLIVLAKNVSESGFERSTSVYKEAENLEGLGKMAKWGPNMNQVSFLVDDYLFHVHVFTSDDKAENKENAIHIAKLMLERL